MPLPRFIEIDRPPLSLARPGGAALRLIITAPTLTPSLRPATPLAPAHHLTPRGTPRSHGPARKRSRYSPETPLGAPRRSPAAARATPLHSHNCLVPVSQRQHRYVGRDRRRGYRRAPPGRSSRSEPAVLRGPSPGLPPRNTDCPPC